jgi:light-regulated signal transduction histidine kinase (bacteriophytochrome)
LPWLVLSGAILSSLLVFGMVYSIASARSRAEKLAAERTKDLRELNRELDERVHKRTAQLQEAVNELESFSYSVSHDLRAPLRHIHGFASLMLEDSRAFDEEKIHHLKTISKAALKMGRLIDDLLALARTSRAELRVKPVDLARLIESVREECQHDAGNRQIRWNIGPLPLVEGDAGLLQVALMNLVGNAVKFTAKRDDARIEIGALDGDSDEVVIYIRDNGAGFDMSYAGKLFHVFQRLHSEDEYDGTGIGLATVNRIMQRLRGRVWAEGAVDKGATFFFALKRGQEGAEASSENPSHPR